MSITEDIYFEVQHSDKSESELSRLSNSELIDYIVKRYHEQHRLQIDGLIRLAQKVETVHLDHDLVPMGLTSHLLKMKAELLQHMEKEEKVLFPILSRDFIPMVRGPINVMQLEHDDHKLEIGVIHKLTHFLKTPSDACNTWKELYSKIDTFIHDLLDHIEIENEILFPRGIQKLKV